MRFLTPSQCDEWIRSRNLGSPLPHLLIIYLPKESGRLLFLARTLAYDLTFRMPCLFRATNWDIWRNNNWNLYYRLRQTYGDHLLLEEAPGHLFLDDEMEDLTTFIYLAMLFGWDAQLRSAPGYASANLSHDEWIDVHADEHNVSILTDLKAVADDAKLKTELRLGTPGAR